jgi:hypothetical protein
MIRNGLVDEGYICIYIYILLNVREIVSLEVKEIFCNKRKLLSEALKKNSFFFQVIILNLFFIKEKKTELNFLVDHRSKVQVLENI